MAFETGRTFSPSVRNPVSGATGLIQFMPSTARGLGTTADDLAALTAEDQLVWVEKYFQPYAGKLNELDDVYMAILWPKAVGKLLTYPLFSADDTESKAYVQNKGLDVNADGVVTKGEATAYVQKLLNEGLQPRNWLETDWESGVGTPISPTPIPTPPAAPKPPQTPDLPPSPPPEKPMLAALPLLQLFAPILSSMIPQIAGLLKPGSEVAQRNVGLAQVVLDTITKATNQPNLQGAIEAMQADPALKQTVQAAIVSEPELIGLMEIGGGIKAARDASVVMQTADRPFWYNPMFWISAAFFPMMYLIVVAVLFTVQPSGAPATGTPWWAMVGFDQATRSGLVNLIVGMVFGGVVGVWFGTSYGSQRKTELSAATKE
jgi:hypothetical protein